MIDINLIRENPDKVKEVIKKRGNPEWADIDKWLKIDKERGILLQTLESLNKKRNDAGKLGKEGKVEEARKLTEGLKKEIKDAEDALNNITVEWQQILDWIPNIPVEGAMPDGAGDHENIILKAWIPKKGYIKEAEGKKSRGFTEKLMPEHSIHADGKDFKLKSHEELGKTLGIIDKDQGAAVSGSRFTYLLGDAVLLQYSLQRLFTDELLKRGFTPIIPPLLVKDRALYGTSHFPEGKDQVYAIKDENVEENQQLYLVGSTEPSNFAYFINKTLSKDDLPIKLFAYAPAFRSEAGSWGKDTKGIKRMHQFDKLEMNCVCKPEQSNDIFEEFLGINEWLLQSLELPYQLALKCTGDAGYHASAKQVDPEVWLPSQQEFMETMTDTNTTDFQARRSNIKYKDENGKKLFVHTVNDTGVAMGRMIIAILDNYQQPDGTIKVPEALRAFMGKDTINANKKY